MGSSRDEMRASDADRTAVGDRLRAALDEGRLDFTEYDTRLRDAYAAKTYGDLRRLIDDLPVVGAAPPAGAQRSQVVPRQAGAATEPVRGGPPAPEVLRHWLRAVWGSWAYVVSICVVIWAVGAVLADAWYFWPIWVAGPWGAVLAFQTVAGLRGGEPQRWADKRERKRVKRELRRSAEIDRRLRG